MRIALQRIVFAYLMLFTSICFSEDGTKPLNYYLDVTLSSGWKEQADQKIRFKEQSRLFDGWADSVTIAASPLCGKYRSSFGSKGYGSIYRDNIPDMGKGKPPKVSEIIWVLPMSGGELQVGDLQFYQWEMRAEVKALPQIKELIEKADNETRKRKTLLFVYRNGAVQAVRPPDEQAPACSFTMHLVEPGFMQSGTYLARDRTTVGGPYGNNYFPSVFTAFPDEVHLKWFVAHELAIAIIPAQFGSHAGDLYKRFNEQVEKVFLRWAAKIEGSAEEKDLYKGANTGPIVADYLSVYIGGNAGWSVDDFLKYLEKHRQYSIANEGARSDITPVAKQLRERLIRHWYQEMIAMKVKNQISAPDPERTIKNMAELQ